VNCENDTDNSASEMSLIKEKYNLKNESKASAEIRPIKFKSISEAELFLEKLKNSKKVKFSTKFNTSDFKKSSLSFRTTKSNNFARISSGDPERLWISRYDNGAWLSSMELRFNTSENYEIDYGSVSLNETGMPLGWSYEQGTVTAIDSNSFYISGIMTWGLEIIGGLPTYFSYSTTMQIDVNWETRMITYTQIQ
jgi:hypothetical protein